MCIIVGGGISGLYCAYKLSKKYDNIILFESADYFGGRIFTFKKKNRPDWRWEAGGARFTKSMKLLLALIKEFGLEKKIVPISSDSNYIDKTTDLVISSRILNKLINNIIKSLEKQYNQDELRKKTLLQFIKKEFSNSIANLIVNSYGYYSELNIMNAYDAIKLYKSMQSEQFYILNGGLSQLIDKIVSACVKNGVEFNTNTKVTTVNLEKDNITVTANRKKYSAKNVVLAIPKYGLEKINIIGGKIPKSLINSIECEPLERIYCVYPKQHGHVWFNGIGKITTNNKLRYIIPIDESKGIIMISYTDSKFTSTWKKHKDNKLYELLAIELRQIFPNKDIPKPLFIKSHYWKCGCGYWKPKNNSEVISQKMIKPIKNHNLYVCGENYSQKQAWIEGALETSEHVIANIV